jgi:cell division topological specificity factor
MALLDFFKQNKQQGSASLAKERLQILVAHDRKGPGPSYLPQLQADLLKVIRKYVQVDNNAVSVQVEHEGNQEILELNIVLPEN